MKTKNIKSKNKILIGCLLQLSLLLTLSTIAQTQKDVHANTVSIEFGKMYQSGDYSYRLLPAPNNSFCYDIYQNNRLLFHQLPLVLPGKNNRMVFAQKEQAQKIVEVAINKLKKRQLPILSAGELKSISPERR
ncbi:MAG: DUF4907 domain-containing protein [Ginsengibacter sp.]